MPMFIPAALAIGSAIAGAGTVLGTVLSIAAVVSGMLLGAYQQRQAKKDAIAAHNAAQVDRFANVVTTVGPRQLVLGRVRVGGNVLFRGSAGQYKDTFVVHLGIAGHEIDGVEQVYFNDEPVTLNPDGTVNEAPYRQYLRENRSHDAVAEAATYTVDPFSGEITSITPTETVVTLPHTPYGNVVVTGGAGNDSEGGVSYPMVSSVDGDEVTITNSSVFDVPVVITYATRTPKYYAKVWWELGSPNAVADARTMELFPDDWTAAHRNRGIAKLICEFTYNETAFPSGIPNITARVRGAKVYDPRTGVTAFSRNPALLMRHVITHPYFGNSAVSAEEDARIITAANACEVNHDYKVGAGTDIRDLYTADMVAMFGSQSRPILDDLAQAMAGLWCHAGGQFYVRAGVWSAPVINLTEDDVAMVQRDGPGESYEAIEIMPHRERADRFNVVNAIIWDAAQHYKQVALSPIKGADLIAEDGGELPLPITLPAVSHAGQAEHVVSVMMRDARDPVTIDVPFKMKAYPIEIYDVIAWTNARYGFVNKPFLVLNRVWYHERGFVRITAKETAATIFQPNAAFTAQGRAINTRLPAPWEIEPPGQLTAYSGSAELLQNTDGSIVSRIRVTWPAITDKRILEGGFVDVQWRRVGNTAWQNVPVDGSDTEAWLVGVRDGASYVIRARTRTSVARSEWGDHIVHVVIGKTALPARVATPINFDIEDFLLYAEWPDNPEVDIRYYEIRNTDADWGLPGYVYRGRAPRTKLPLPTGSISRSWYIKAVDTGLRYSALARLMTYTRSAPPAPGAISIYITDTSTTVAQITFNWGDVEPDFGLAYYECVLTLPDGTTRVSNRKTSDWTTAYDWVGTATLAVKTVDRGSPKLKSAATTHDQSKVRPPNMGAMTKAVVRGKMMLDWTDVAKTSLPIAGYEIRPSDSGWGGAGYLYRGLASKTPYLTLALGANTWYGRAFDTDGRYSAASVSISHTHNLPANITGLSLSRKGVYIRAVATATAPKDLKHYEFRFLKTTGTGDIWATATHIVRSQTPEADFRPPSLGTWRCSARMVDIDDNTSAASNSGSITLNKIAV